MKLKLLFLLSTVSLLTLTACGGDGTPVLNSPYVPNNVNKNPNTQNRPQYQNNNPVVAPQPTTPPKYKDTGGIHEDIWNDNNTNTNRVQKQPPVVQPPVVVKQPPVVVKQPPVVVKQPPVVQPPVVKKKPPQTVSQAQKKYSQTIPSSGASNTLKKIDYKAIPGWTADNLRRAIPGMLLSCRKITASKDKDSLLNNNTGVGGTPRDWLNVCNALENIKTASNTKLRQFMEKGFTPYKVQENGLYTAYVGYTLQASLVKNKTYPYPIYARPHDLIFVNVGTFDSRYKGKYFSGRLKYPYLIPYYSRRDIYRGVLSNKNLEIAYVKSYIDLLMLQIQGSGLAILPDGTSIRLSYGGNNGYPSKSISQYMMSRGLISPPGSLPQIQAYFRKYPRQVKSITEYNKRYVFFKKSLTSAGVSGAQGVPLTPERSVAIDRKYYPLGLPMFVSTKRPLENKSFNQLVVAQDTGNAIKGPARVDIYWGETKRALKFAGHMKYPGSLFVFLPKKSEDKCRICSR